MGKSFEINFSAQPWWPVWSLELENILMMTSIKLTENKLPKKLVLLHYVI